MSFHYAKVGMVRTASLTASPLKIGSHCEQHFSSRLTTRGLSDLFAYLLERFLLVDHLTAVEVLERLASTVAAGAVIGLDRDKGGHPAGLGTTILVCLAAALAMIEANFLLMTGGKTAGSFGTLDFMRLPLGILTGMGFLGAGSILRRGNRISGLTTAATLWVATVIGLCLGAGELALGGTATAVCVAIGVVAKRVEALIAEDQTADMMIETRPGSSLVPLLEKGFAQDGFSIIALAESATNSAYTYRLRVRRRSRKLLLSPPPTFQELKKMEAITRITWLPEELPHVGNDSLD